MLRLQRPGFGLPLDHLPRWRRGGKDNGRFPHGIVDDFSTSGITIRERRMLDFINQITDKPRWWEKIDDSDIIKRWREEACGTPDQQMTSSNHLDLRSFDYVGLPASLKLRDSSVLDN